MPRRPNLGAKAFAAGWWFDFNLAYVGVGFITPLSVNYSMMVGAILSWGIAYPLLRNKAGDWYPTGLGSNNFRGEFAYHVSTSPRPVSLFLPFRFNSAMLTSCKAILVVVQAQSWELAGDQLLKLLGRGALACQQRLFVQSAFSGELGMTFPVSPSWQVFWSIALYLGDGGYQIIKMGIISYTHWLMQRRGANIGEPMEGKEGKEGKEVPALPPSCPEPRCLGNRAKLLELLVLQAAATHIGDLPRCDRSDAA